MASSSSSSFSNSWNYDVFLSFRGKDTRKNFVDHLYSALVDRLIITYKDDETLPRGKSIGPTLLKAIEHSRIAVIVFSKNYASSSWCLDELSYIMKCRNKRGLIVIPIFYDVDPSDVRKQKRKYGEAFAKHELENNNRVKSWRKALVEASNIAGWETNHIANGYESIGLKTIVDTISDKLFSLNSVADKDLVGMGTRSQYLRSHLQIGARGVRMIGIWGMGGSGKTTIATYVYMEISSYFKGHCIVDNIREESSKHGLKKLQEKILSTVLKTQVEVQSVEEGKHKIRSRLCRSNVLIVLDDVDDRKQLEALAGSHDWFGNGSRIIITTRDKHLLNAHKVDNISSISLLSKDEAIRLFNKHAYNENNLVKDYNMLSKRVVSYAGGLPLALKVLGSFLYDKDNVEWVDTLNRLKENPEMEIVDMLKISYDGLKHVEKELFLDIACFFRGKGNDEAMKMLDACGFHPVIGITVLRQKALITIVDGKFDMHDLVHEMALYIVRGDHPNNPEKHSRVWRSKEIEDMGSRSATPIQENDKIEAIIYDGYGSSHLPNLVSNMKKLRLLYVLGDRKEVTEGPNFLSNELRYIYWSYYPASPLPEKFQPTKLVILKLYNTWQEELWKGHKCLPHLKELHLKWAPNLLSTPDFDGLPCLKKLDITGCYKLKDIHPSLGNHKRLVSVVVICCDKLKMFPTITRMEKLENLRISCGALLEFPKFQANMDSLVDLSINNSRIEVFPSSIGEYCTNLTSLRLSSCRNLKRIEGNFHGLKRLREVIFPGCTLDRNMPKDFFDERCCLEELSLCGVKQLVVPHLPRFLKKLNLSGCNLKDGDIPRDIGVLIYLQELKLSSNEFSRLDISLSQLTRLKLLNLSCCDNLLQLPKLPSSIAILDAEYCKSLSVLGDWYPNCKYLCKISLVGARSIIDGNRLLQFMLHEGKAMENYCMSLRLPGLEIANTFMPPLTKGSTCRLQLPENWCNDFSGFLMCAIMTNNYAISHNISMSHNLLGIAHDISTGRDLMDLLHEINMCPNLKGIARSDTYNQPGFWKKGDKDIATWVGYVSFGSLRHTTWWDETYDKLDFSLNAENNDNRELCSGFGVTLVTRKNATKIKTDSSELFCENNAYLHKFKILDDSKFCLDISPNL